jgi:hypothetical protein
MRISNRKIFELNPKVKLPQLIFACIFVVFTLVGPILSKYYEIKMHCATQDVATRLYDEEYFLVQYFCPKPRPTGYPGHDP